MPEMSNAAPGRHHLPGLTSMQRGSSAIATHGKDNWLHARGQPISSSCLWHYSVT